MPAARPVRAASNVALATVKRSGTTDLTKTVRGGSVTA